MLILSHRGYHATAPENTVEAFQQSIAMGADGIETDVRNDSDGLPILFHDRHAPDGQAISALSRNRLSDLVGYPVPSVEEALAISDRVLWNLEIKVPAAVAATMKIVRPLLRSHRVLITSFWHNVISGLSQEESLDYGLVIAHRPVDSDSSLSLFPPTFHSRVIVWDYERADPHLLANLASRGVRHFVYGLATREEHQRALGWPLEGLITDHLDFAR
jgi:glycerophosphoryl diester phosphodiesterase